MDPRAEQEDLKSAVDPYGFERPEDFDYEAYEAFMSNYLAVLARRAAKWSGLMQANKSAALKRSPKLKRYIRKGVPSAHRPLVWMVVSGAETRRQQNPQLYQQLLRGPHEQELIDIIRTDLHRTFPDNIYFQTDQATDPLCKSGPLYSVLLALAHNNRRIGYCQGLNFIAGLMLLVIKDEESAFWMMDTLINRILPDYYASDMIGVKVDQEVLGELVSQKVPDVARYMESAGCAWALISTKWFICLFADVFPVETVLRIWDCLMYEGTKVLFRVGLVLVKRYRMDILSCPNFPAMMTLFKGMAASSTVTHCHQFMEAIFSETGSFPRARITQLRKHWHNKITKEGL